MAVKLSPVYLDAQFIDGIPAVGAKLFTYAAGSTSKQATYTDSTGTVANSNPIILNARGEPPAIWLASGQTYKFVLASPTDSDPPTSPIRVIDNVSGVNDTSINIDEWVASNLTPTYLSSTQFTVAGDQTSLFQVNRRVKLLVSAGTVYGYISASTYTSLTTVTVTLDSGALDTGLSQVSLALLSSTNPSVPALIDTLFRIVKSSVISIYAKFDLSLLTTSRTLSIQDKSGTIALTSDLLAVVNATNDPTYASTSATNAAAPEWVGGYVGKKAVGVNQTWQAAELTNTGATFTDGTAKYRAYGTTYTNTTGRPIVVSVTSSNGGSLVGSIIFNINGSPVAYQGVNAATAGNQNSCITMIVPNGNTYSVTNVNSGSISYWYELR